MYLVELLGLKRNLDLKIKELQEILLKDQNEVAAQLLFSLIDERRNILFQISTANDASHINYGGSEINISMAVIVRDSMQDKINFLTELINSDSCKLDKIELQLQRDKYYSDYTLLNTGIIRNDLQVRLN